MVSGIPFEFENSKGDGRRRPWIPSIDRIDSSKGYTKGNCRIVCCAVNIAMNNYGEDVLARISEYMTLKRISENKSRIEEISLKKNNEILLRNNELLMKKVVSMKKIIDQLDT